MRLQYRMAIACALFVFILLHATPVLIPGPQAEEPTIVVQIVDGQSYVYSASDIVQIYFEGEDALIIVTSSGSDSYEMETIRRIEFLCDFASIEDPEDAAALIKTFHLFQNQPNPFSANTKIRYELPLAGEVKLQIFSPDGRLVRTLVTGERAAGPQTVQWDGMNEAGEPAAGGVYFYNLSAPGIKENRQMILLP